jgi:hypothetical protein
MIAIDAKGLLHLSPNYMKELRTHLFKDKTGEEIGASIPEESTTVMLKSP